MPDDPTLDAIGRLVRDLLHRERLANTVAADTAESLDELFQQIADVLTRIDPTAVTRLRYRRSRTDRVLKEIQGILRKYRPELESRLRGHLAEIGRAEALRAQGTLVATLGEVGERAVRATPITQARLRAILTTDPFRGKTLKEHTQRLAANVYDRTLAEIRLGMVREESIQDIVRRVRGRQAGFIRQDAQGRFVARGTRAARVRPRFTGGVLSTTTRDAEALVRTAVNHVSNVGMMETYRANADVVTGVQFVATLDDRVTVLCASLDGSVFPIDSGDIPTPPLHFNALLDDQRVRTLRGLVPVQDVRVGDVALTHAGRWRPVYAVMGRPIGGSRALRLQTSSGGVLCVTDEHPVLTAKGWRRAGDLQVGDQVFEDAKELPRGECGVVGTRVPQIVLESAHDRPSSLHKPAVPFNVLSHTAGVSAAVQFQINSALDKREVENVGTDRVLAYGRRSSALEYTHHERLVAGGALAVRDGPRLRRSPPGLPVVGWVAGARHAPPMNLGKPSGRLGLVGTPMRVPGGGVTGRRIKTCRFGLTANVDAVTVAPSVECRLPDADFALNLPDRLPGPEVLSVDEGDDVFTAPEPSGDSHGNPAGEWILTTITNIADVDYDGNVWNLAVECDETYVAEGVVVHNCRSILTPVIGWEALGLEPPPDFQRTARDLSGVSDEDLARKVSARRRTGGFGPATRVSSSTVATDWLRRQRPEVQNRLLGTGKARLFREGKITLKDIVRDDFTIVPLSELASVN